MKRGAQSPAGLRRPVPGVDLGHGDEADRAADMKSAQPTRAVIDQRGERIDEVKRARQLDGAAPEALPTLVVRAERLGNLPTWTQNPTRQPACLKICFTQFDVWSSGKPGLVRRVCPLRRLS